MPLAMIPKAAPLPKPALGTYIQWRAEGVDLGDRRVAVLDFVDTTGQLLVTRGVGETAHIVTVRSLGGLGPAPGVLATYDEWRFVGNGAVPGLSDSYTAPAGSEPWGEQVLGEWFDGAYDINPFEAAIWLRRRTVVRVGPENTPGTVISDVVNTDGTISSISFLDAGGATIAPTSLGPALALLGVIRFELMNAAAGLWRVSCFGDDSTPGLQRLQDITLLIGAVPGSVAASIQSSIAVGGQQTLNLSYLIVPAA